MKREIELNGSTKLCELLEIYPWLKQKLQSIDEKFKMLNTPVGAVMIKKVTLSDMGSRSGLGEQVIIEKIRQLIAANA